MSTKKKSVVFSLEEEEEQYLKNFRYEDFRETFVAYVFYFSYHDFDEIWCYIFDHSGAAKVVKTMVFPAKSLMFYLHRTLTKKF